jgi:putative transposase
MAISFKGAHFPQDIILMGVRWYLAYPLSYRHVEELLEERGVPIDHATIQRWVVKYSPQLEAALVLSQSCFFEILAVCKSLNF